MNLECGIHTHSGMGRWELGEEQASGLGTLELQVDGDCTISSAGHFLMP